MRTLSPASLEETCLNFICTNVEALCREDNKNVEDLGFSFPRLTFISPIFLHEQLAENIMKTLSCRGKLTTRIATLFSDPNTCRIRKLDLRETEVAAAVIKHLLIQHRVLKLDLHGATLSSSVLDELLNLVSSTLRELNVSDTSCHFSSIHPLRCLTHLDASNTYISDDEVFLASQHLHCLQCLNISHTAVSKTTSFANLKSQLKTLLAFDAPVAWRNPVEFREFTSLQMLDISRNPDNMSGYDWPSDAEKLEEMLGDKDVMPNLTYLDVSGTPRILDCPLQTFLNSHPKLHFLGLCKTGLTSHAKWLPTNIKITGEANEQQILSSLQAYPDRASYMTEALRGLFHCSKNWTERKPEVLQLVLSPLEKHPEDLRVQMAATACVFNIIRGGGGSEEDVHPTYLSKIASLALSAMNNFPDKQDLLRNCLLILETRQLLNKANFDFFKACSSAMDALCLFSSDQNISRLATKLCAILSSKISTSETLDLGSERNIVTLLNIAQEKISGNEADYTLSLTLSALWNLTDEAPSTCLLFVEKGGLQIAAQGLKAFRGGIQDQHIIIMRKILGMLNNIAEVSELRKCLITVDFMNLFRSFLEDQPIQLSYFSGGILSNVLLNWSEDEDLPLFIKELTLLELEKAVKGWELPSEELVSYRTFNPFVELLESPMPAVQMWALWGMLHVCSRNAKRYIPLLVDGGIIEIAEQMIGPSCEGVSELAIKLIKVMKDSQV